MLAKYSITLLHSLTSRCPKLLTISLQELLRFVKVVELFNNSIHKNLSKLDITKNNVFKKLEFS